ncbi:hypothetical protein [Mycobacterium camsae]|uniref:hypothetical protein n=1 Tax=Mycobacterium gordonae TaxID=1778 RepID=UPI003217F675
MCATNVLAGLTIYVRPPLEPPESGEVLICSAVPRQRAGAGPVAIGRTRSRRR